MKNKKIFIACDGSKISKIKKIIKETNSKEIQFGYKFGLEFINSKNGRKTASQIMPPLARNYAV